MTATDLMGVDAFANELPDAAFAALNPADESLADGIGQSYGIVGYRGKVWTLRLRGETHTFTRKDDGTPSAFLDCIILRSAGYKSKSYYPAGSFEQDSGGQRPVCSALDGVTPDADVATPQATACAICPRNEWKTDANGKKRRECSDYKRLAVLLLPAETARLLGSALVEPVFLRIPAASLNDLAVLGEAMQKKGFHYSSYITRIGFNPEMAHPQMTFRALQKLTAAEAPVVLPLREDAQALRITGENEVGKPRPVGAVTHQPAGQQSVSHTPSTEQTVTKPSPAATQTTTSPSKPAEVEPEDEIAKMERTLAEAKARKLAEAAKVKPAEPETVSTGFGELILPNKTASTAGATQAGGELGAKQSVVEVGSTSEVANASTANTIEDTGEPEDADAALNARVQGLLGK
jgi:hypothetical protein